MPIRYQASEVPTSYATCSIGYQESHTLPLKLKAIADAGFDAVELSMPDILAYGKMLNGSEPDPKDYDALVEVGHAVKAQMVEHGLKVMMLQPFANFEGWPRGSTERADAFERARGWIRVMEAVGTDLLQVGSSDAPGIADSSVDDMATDLAELADLCAPKGFRVAYENWCWATRAPAWKDVWDIVKRADRPNLGLCLDTFQSGGGEWADPTTKSGLVEEEGASGAALERVAGGAGGDGAREQDLPAADLGRVQDGPAARRRGRPRIGAAAARAVEPRLPPPAVRRGYLPVREFLNAVLATGFRGYLSMEVFDPKGQEKRYPDMGAYAKKAMDSLEKLLVA
ncbi:uncharacterized protein PG986_003726 [Apiospora aurea]|uniref:Xylose isomerase-like TIM barrel domain-containing protein n=1 Tax=Apiospora aurea TaxID=335848 RepID=A0ABR1QSI5_9PEZI